MEKYIPIQFQDVFWKKIPKRDPISINNVPFSGICIEIQGSNFCIGFRINGISHGLQLSCLYETPLSVESTITGQRYFGIDSFRKDSSFSYRLVMTNEDIPFESLICNEKGEKFDNGEQDIEITLEDLDIEKTLSINTELLDFIKSLEQQTSWCSLSDTLLLYYNPKIDKILSDKAQIVLWAYERQKEIEKGFYIAEDDYLADFIKVKTQKKLILQENRLPTIVSYIGSVGISYNIITQNLSIVLLITDATTREVVEQAIVERKMRCTYVPEIYSFCELPVVLEAFEQIKTKPEIIFCNGFGTNHIFGVGLASQIGLSLDIPTIACSRRRVIGAFDKESLGVKKGNFEPLLWDNVVVGAALRTKTDANPIFVSIGHKIDLDTAISQTLVYCEDENMPYFITEVEKQFITLGKKHLAIDYWSDGYESVDWEELCKEILVLA